MRFKLQAVLTVWEMDRSKVIVVEKNDPQFDMVGCILKLWDLRAHVLSLLQLQSLPCDWATELDPAAAHKPRTSNNTHSVPVEKKSFQFNGESIFLTISSTNTINSEINRFDKCQCIYERSNPH